MLFADARVAVAVRSVVDELSKNNTTSLRVSVAGLISVVQYQPLHLYICKEFSLLGLEYSLEVFALTLPCNIAPVYGK